MIQDLRYSVRLLRKSPRFALTAILSLALGIGATTAMFSVIYAALINPYSFTAADRMMRMSVQTKDGSVDTVNLNPRQIQQLRDVSLIQSVLAMDYHAMTLTGRDLPENVNVIGLISNGWEDLGMQTALGRGFSGRTRSKAAIPNLSRCFLTSSGRNGSEETQTPSGSRCNSIGRTTPSWTSRRRGSPVNAELFVNAKAEAYWCLREWLERGGIARLTDEEMQAPVSATVTRQQGG